jgi:hypothetical protein
MQVLTKPPLDKPALTAIGQILDQKIDHVVA